jgi:hypothetical protein
MHKVCFIIIIVRLWLELDGTGNPTLKVVKRATGIVPLQVVWSNKRIAYECPAGGYFNVCTFTANQGGFQGID